MKVPAAIAVIAFLTLTASNGRAFAYSQPILQNYTEIIVTGPGEFTTPNYPLNYTSDLNLTWVLTAPDSDSRVHIIFVDFETEANSDELNVRDGPNNQSPIIYSRHSGLVRPGAAISKHGSSLFVNFLSDRNIELKGFRAIYDLSYEKTFTEDIVGVEGSLSSPHYYTGKYPIDIEYVWNIKSPEADSLVQITFIRIEVARNGEDFVEIFDGDTLLANVTCCILSQGKGIVSNTNELQIKFKVNSNNSTHTHPGFRIIYETIAPIDVEESGSAEIIGYGRNADVSWHFRTTRYSAKVALYFGYSHVREDYDYLEIRDGHLPTSPLLHNLTGSWRDLGYVYGSGRSLYVRLRAHEYNNYGQLSMTAVPDIIEKELTAVDGNIRTPGWYYIRNAHYTWKLTVPSGRVRLGFNYDMDTEEGVDFVEIFDGNSTDASLLGRLSGTPAVYENKFISTGNQLFVRFKSSSQANGERGGFYGAFESIRDNTVYENVCHLGGCRTLTIPNYPLPTPHSLAYAWEFIADDTVVEISFEEFSTVEQGDALTVYDGWDKREILGTFWGSEIPDTLMSTRNGMYIIYRSNAVNESQGFKVHTVNRRWEEFADPKGGEFASPFYPNKYYPWAKQSWRLYCPGSIVQVVFHDFELQPRYESVQLRAGNSTSGSLIASFAGANLPHPVYSTTERMYVSFGADGIAPTTRGFKASFVCAKTSWLINGEADGVIKSPHYPQNYSNSLEQTWLVSVPMQSPNSVIVLEFDEFDTEEEFDYLIVKDGALTSDPVLANVSGTLAPGYKIQGSTNQVLIEFVSDDKFNSTGFNIRFSTLDLTYLE